MLTYSHLNTFIDQPMGVRVLYQLFYKIFFTSTTSFPGSLIYPALGASEERPRLGLTTCYFDKWEDQGGVLCTVELWRAATAILLAMFTSSLPAKITNSIYSDVIYRLGKSVSRQFTVVVILLPSYPLDLWNVGHISTGTSSSPILFRSDSY